MGLTVPLQVGLPQVVLLVVGLLAVALLVTSVLGLRPADQVDTGGQTDGPTRSRTRLRHRVRVRLRLRRGVTGVVTLAVATSLLWFTLLVQTFLGLTGEIHAAHVTATPVRNAPHMLSVTLTIYDEHGAVGSTDTYLVEGDRWVLQANILRLKHWVNILGVHSGYQVTRLFGQYDDGRSPEQRQIFLDGTDEAFFRSMRDHDWWTTPFVDSAYGNAVIATPGDYDVYISQDAITARPATG
jgi:hypothetical protein